ncbi:MAG: helix-hairpin-helix domain-containing protein, partial [Candidatus Methanomethylicia archaeon]
MAEVDLTELDGVGPSTAQKLKDAGYTTYESIAVASVRELAASADIPESIAAKIIASARERLEITFMTAEELLQKRSQIVRISTGSKNLDNLLG